MTVPTVQRRKLQIFLSSTYTDLISHRLVAMEAILAVGHIPAAMEQFSPGDETAWEKICRWIDDSDAYILILGGRYGSIDPETGKSYTHREYEYALSQNKPFVSLVIKDAHLEARVQKEGFQIDERKHPTQYREFKALVQRKHCAFWGDKNDIKSLIFQKLPEWSQRDDLVGWIRGDEGLSLGVTEELARLSQENSELRAQVSSEDFDGLSFEQMVSLLREETLGGEIQEYLLNNFDVPTPPNHRGHAFEVVRESVAGGFRSVGYRGDLCDVIDLLVVYGLVSKAVTLRQRFVRGTARSEEVTDYSLSDVGRRFSNKLMTLGDLENRWSELWSCP